MKITFPHLGYCSIPLRSLLADLGHEVIIPPPITRKTISLGTRHGPEFACYPLKLGLGNFIEALELGADTLLMGGGIGPCRFGYYAQVQRDILQSLGYKFRMLVVEPPLGHARQFLAVLREVLGEKSWSDLARAAHLALVKLGACDDIQRASLKLRPLAQDKSAFSKLYRRALEEIDMASGVKAVREAKARSIAAMEAMPRLNHKPPKVALVGEVYLIAEPAANLHIEERLGNMGVEVCRHVWISQWLRVNIFLDFAPAPPGKGGKISPSIPAVLCGRSWPTFSGRDQEGNSGGDRWRNPRLPLYLHPGNCRPGDNAKNGCQSGNAPGLFLNG